MLLVMLGPAVLSFGSPNPSLLSFNRLWWCPRVVGSCGSSVESLHLLMASSSTITRTSGSCTWPPRAGNRFGKIMVSNNLKPWPHLMFLIGFELWAGQGGDRVLSCVLRRALVDTLFGVVSSEQSVGPESPSHSCCK